MKKAVNFWVAFFLELGTMISLSTRPSRVAKVLLEKDGEQSGIAQHFEAAWNYLAAATEKYK